MELSKELHPMRKYSSGVRYLIFFTGHVLSCLPQTLPLPVVLNPAQYTHSGFQSGWLLLAFEFETSVGDQAHSPPQLLPHSALHVFELKLVWLKFFNPKYINHAFLHFVAFYNVVLYVS